MPETMVAPCLGSFPWLFLLYFYGVLVCLTQDSLHFPVFEGGSWGFGFSGCTKGWKRYMIELSWALLLYFDGFQDA